MSEILYDYTEEVDPNLICAICRSALVDPVTTSTCKHTFCRDCISRAITVNPTCPIDRSALSMHSLRDTEQLVKLMLDELKVKCLAEGCGLEMQRGLLLGHIRTCPKSIITCPDGDCGISMTRNRQPHHRAYECFQRKMECGKCGTVLTFRNHSPSHLHHEDHKGDPESDTCSLCLQSLGTDKNLHPWTCPLVRMPCPHQNRGCPAIIVRSALPSHLQTCAYEAMSGFFEMNDTRLASIEERQLSLERQNESLKREVERLTEGLTIARQSLGSMWRRRIDEDPVGLELGLGSVRGQGRNEDLEAVTPSEGSPPIGHPFNSAFETGEAILHSAATEVIDPEEGSNPTLGASQLPPTTIDPTLSSIPNFLEATTPSAPRQSYVDWTFNRFSSTGTGLDELISGLRSVTVHIAAGIDNMERRNEVRAMTDSLRVLEEVGSLRAIVNTLRMQVMMDRSTSVPVLRPPPSPRSSLHSMPSTLRTSITSTRTAVEQTPSFPDPEPPMPSAPPQTRPPIRARISRSSSVSLQQCSTRPFQHPPALITHASPTAAQQVTASEEHPDEDDDTLPDLDNLSVRESVVFSDEHHDGARSVRGPIGLGERSSNSSTQNLFTISSSASATGRGWSGRPMGIPDEAEYERYGLASSASGSASGPSSGPGSGSCSGQSAGPDSGPGSLGRNSGTRLKRASTFGRSLLGRRTSFKDQPRL